MVAAAPVHVLIFMANIIDNVDLEKIAQTVEAGKRDRSTLRRPVKLKGEWILDPAVGYQFRTEMAYEKGKQVVEIDSPSWMGGQGNKLGPMAYCVTGISSCFVSTFATVAANAGVKLTKLSANVECMLNFAKTFEVADEPIMEGLKIQLEAEAANADKTKLQKLLLKAEEQCPAIYSMTHIIKVQAEIK